MSHRNELKDGQVLLITVKNGIQESVTIKLSKNESFFMAVRSNGAKHLCYRHNLKPVNNLDLTFLREPLKLPN